MAKKRGGASPADGADIPEGIPPDAEGAALLGLVQPLGGDGPDPTPGDPAWNDFVMRHLENDELDPDGRPLVHGLRRVTEQLIGPVLSSTIDVVQVPTETLPAVAVATIRVLWTRPSAANGPHERVFGEAADVHAGNTSPEMLRYATAVCATRAEARAYRKLLRLRSAVSDEIGVAVPVAEAPSDGKATPAQQNYLGLVASRCEIDLMKFVNSGKGRYASLADIPAEIARRMLEKLNEYQRNPESVPANILLTPKGN